jgi:hypothetical protein
MRPELTAPESRLEPSPLADANLEMRRRRDVARVSSFQFDIAAPSRLTSDDDLDLYQRAAK